MGLLVALEFLTRFRVRRRPGGDLAALARAQGWFPAVGLLLGAVLLGIDRLVSRGLPQPSVDVVLVVALVAMTGALHLDGLADTADGIWGGGDLGRRLEIMRDASVGVFGVVAVVSVLALKWAGLAAVPGSVRYEALLVAPCLARFALTVQAPVVPAARDEGLGAAFRAAAAPARAALGAATAAAAAALLFGAGAVAVLALASACGLLVGLYSTARIGGMTGDVYGATVEVTEAVVFLAIAALARREWISAWILG
jgi:adenosylcobinamide-GDP ribazoletransferase